MKGSRLAVRTIAVVAMVACAGVVLAQAPDWGPPAGGPGAGPRGAQRGPGMRGRAPALAMLLAGENIQTEISNTDNGVKLAITSTDEAALGQVQERVLTGVDRMKETAQQLGERLEQRPFNERVLRRDPLLLVAAGKARVSAEKTENGVTLSFTADDPETVQLLQEQAPQWVATATQVGERRRQAEERRRQMQAARELLANEAVKIEIEETEAGILVKVTSDDPELVKQVKENLPVYFEAQAQMARRAGRRQGGAAGARGFGARGGRGRGRGGRGMGGPAGGPPEF